MLAVRIHFQPRRELYNFGVVRVGWTSGGEDPFGRHVAETVGGRRGEGVENVGVVVTKACVRVGFAIVGSVEVTHTEVHVVGWPVDHKGVGSVNVRFRRRLRGGNGSPSPLCTRGIRMERIRQRFQQATMGFSLTLVVLLALHQGRRVHVDDGDGIDPGQTLQSVRLVSGFHQGHVASATKGSGFRRSYCGSPRRGRGTVQSVVGGVVVVVGARQVDAIEYLGFVPKDLSFPKGNPQLFLVDKESSIVQCKNVPPRVGLCPCRIVASPGRVPFQSNGNLSLYPPLVVEQQEYGPDRIRFGLRRPERRRVGRVPVGPTGPTAGVFWVPHTLGVGHPGGSEPAYGRGKECGGGGPTRDVEETGIGTIGKGPSWYGVGIVRLPSRLIHAQFGRFGVGQDDRPRSPDVGCGCGQKRRHVTTVESVIAVGRVRTKRTRRGDSFGFEYDRWSYPFCRRREHVVQYKEIGTDKEQGRAQDETRDVRPGPSPWGYSRTGSRDGSFSAGTTVGTGEPPVAWSHVGQHGKHGDDSRSVQDRPVDTDAVESDGLNCCVHAR